MSVEERRRTPEGPRAAEQTLPHVGRYAAAEDRSRPEGARISVLVAFGRRHYCYGAALAHAIRSLRPLANVALSRLERADGLLAAPGPQLVITDQPEDVVGASAPARLEISTDPREPSRFSAESLTRELSNPTLEEVLAVVDEVALLAGGQVADELDLA